MGENFLLACWHDAGYVGKSIIVLLIAMSLYSWSIMLVKWQAVRQARKDSEKFVDRYRANRRNIFHLYARLNSFRKSPVTEIYKLACQQIYPHIPAEGSADSGEGTRPIRSRLTKSKADAIGENLVTVISSQTAVLERQMVFLATAASASPFIGLFGTVWGVMISFRGMGIEGSASLATVAPGISEALITTAAGLAVAIPALVGHNYIQSQIRATVRLMEDFATDIVSQALLHYEAE
jgi:biopolymer transport protein TolQ